MIALVQDRGLSIAGPPFARYPAGVPRDPAAVDEAVATGIAPSFASDVATDVSHETGPR